MAIISLKLVCHSCFSAGNFTRFGYDKETETCEEFNYGGCKGDISNIQVTYIITYFYLELSRKLQQLHVNVGV